MTALREGTLATAIREALRAYADSATELDVAKAIRAGDLPSPQKYENVWLFALRITGTGNAYRPAHDEYVYRTPDNYLTDEFLERCTGLPVVFEHPTKGVLDTAEYRERAIGTVLLPWIKGDEVWGIAKIYDADAARLMQTTHISTSPAVVFRDADSTESVETGDGKTLLIEGKPSYLDHLAICEEGVWDKGGEPNGIQLTEEADMAEEMVPAWADALSKRFDEVCNRIDALEKGRADGDFDKLEHKLEEEGKSKESAEKIAGAIGEKKYGKEGMEKKAEEGKEKAERKDETTEEKAAEEERESEKAGEREIKAAEKAGEREERAERADSVTRTIAELREQIASLSRPLSPAERDELAKVHARADTLATMLGETVHHPLHGETPIAYRKRLASKFQKFSKVKDVKLDSIDGAAFDFLEEKIYADAKEAALSPSESAPARLVPIITRDDSGRQITRYAGNSDAFKVAFAPFMQQPVITRVTKPYRNQEAG